MMLWWGTDLIQFYNDAHKPSLVAQGLHPNALGVPARAVWAEVWSFIAPQVDHVLSGRGGVRRDRVRMPVTLDGRREHAYWTYTYSPVFDDEGRISGVLIACDEDMERVRALERLQERERMLAVIGRTAMVGGWRVERDGSLRLTDEVLALQGHVERELATPEHMFALYSDDSQANLEEAFQACMEQGQPFDLELEARGADGGRRWWRVVGEPVRSRRGHVVAVQGALQDIDEPKRVALRAAESERKFIEMAENLPLIVWTAGPDGAVDYQSRSMHLLSGLDADHLAGDGWLTALHPDDVDRVQQLWQRCVATGEPYQTDFRIRATTGEYRWYQTVARPLRDRSGRVVRWVGSSVDVHDQLRLRREAEQLAADLQATFESITDAVYLLDPSWRLIFINTEASRLLGVSRREVLGRSLWEVFPGVVGTVLEERYRQAAQERASQSFDFFYPEVERLFQVRVFPSSRGLAVYFLDVTAERAMVARLREQSELLDLAQDAILVRRLDHTIEFWNRGAERLYGWTRGQAIGRSIRELLYDDPAKFDAATAEVLAKGSWAGEIEHVRRDGTGVVVEGRWTLVRDGAGEPERILAINTDVTERRRLVRQFERAQRLESIGTLAGGIAHDLNNVLTPILLMIWVLRRKITDDSARDDLSIIEASAKRGADMVKQVLGFARGYERSDISIDVAEVLDQVARVLRDTFPKNIQLHFDVPRDLWRVTGDPTQLHQVAINLLVNARDALPGGGTIRVTAQNIAVDENYAAMCVGASPGAHVRITVMDTGVGMSPTVLQQIFDPFFTTKDIGVGTGLGLSTVRAIVKSYGGFVNVYSEPGNGATFQVYIPAESTVRLVGSDHESGEVLRGRGELILVVDDERSIRDISRETLEAFGYRVVTATDGADAVAEFSQSRGEIAAVLTDMLMPIMDGPTLIRALRRIDPQVRVIAASGLGATGAVGRAAEAGAQEFLAKPYTADALLRVVRRILDAED